MTARRTPSAQDAAAARRILFDAMADGVAVGELLSRLAPLHPRNDTFPGEVLLDLAADVVDWAGPDRAHPIDLESMRERFLPDVDLRGRERRKLEFAVLAAAALRGGVRADLLDEVAWWGTDDFWCYGAYAAVAYLRIAADRIGVPVSDICRALAR